MQLGRNEYHIAELGGVRKDEKKVADEIAKRFNLYPRLIAFIQHLGSISDDAETIDFIVNNYEDVMEDKEGNPIEEDIPFLNNEQIFKD